MNLAAFLFACAAVVSLAELPADFSLPPAPGPFATRVDSSAYKDGFKSGQPLVATTYFYWYDIQSKAHIIDADGTDALTDHPPTLVGFSYKNPAWHEQQLRDMIEAGIDVVLPVYWGTPIGGFTFSNEGLPPLIQAREKLLAEGLHPPAIGMFYDTSTLRHNPKRYHIDLTTPAGKLWFYGTIRNFFSLVPPQHRATIDGRPLVFLYTASFAKKVDETIFPAVQEMFRRQFGTPLFVVAMTDWPAGADSQYQWGGALRPRFFDTAAIGPGYDHSAVPGRQPLVRDRENGAFYSSAWEQLLMRNPETRPWLVHIETWNEFHEGTEICHSREYGRQYIELTRKYADLFHKRVRIDPARGKPRTKVSASPDCHDGLRPVPKADGDGPIDIISVGNRKAWTTRPNRFSTTRYMYFDVSPQLLFDGDATVEVVVEYLDSGPAAFSLQYDSAYPEVKGLAQAFYTAGTQAIVGTGRWHEATFRLVHARFADRANGADFRLVAHGAELVVARVTVRLVKSN